MFDRIKKALLGDGKAPVEPRPSELANDPVSEWATATGMLVTPSSPGKALAMSGKVQGKPWRMEIGRPTRNYIHGEELRARAELGAQEDIAALVLNRPLKEALEKLAYSMITDTLQTTADPNLPEEMRWLAMFDEVGWDSAPEGFWDRYAVFADRREHALAWMEPAFMEALMDWPPGGPSREVPFIVALMRGKGYLRMEYVPPTADTVKHAARIFTAACEASLGAFPAR
jgi:hypothetical protein